MRIISLYIAVALGSALGGMARYWSSLLMSRLMLNSLLLDIIVINIIGSFFVGCFAALWEELSNPAVLGLLRYFLMFGICGGYTSFSAFSLQNLYLLQKGRFWLAAFNIILSVLLSLVSVWLAYIGTKKLITL